MADASGFPKIPAGLLVGGGPKTSKIPQSSVISRLQAFMPKMKRANDELEETISGGGGASGAGVGAGTAETGVVCCDPDMELQGEGGMAACAEEDGEGGEGGEGGADGDEGAGTAVEEEGGAAAATKTIFKPAAAVEMDVALGVWDSEETEAAAVAKLEAGGSDDGLAPTMGDEPQLKLPGQPKPGAAKPVIEEVADRTDMD